MSKGRVVLAMSGGVDSSVSAHKLVEAGFDVVGLFMRTGTHDEAPRPTSRIRGCCSALDAADARQIADDLDIPFYSLNFAEEFSRIKDYFVNEYLIGRTPNPCVVCNTWLKFGKLWHYARTIEADFIATGHYARTFENTDGEFELHAAVDATKDQSYFLSGIQRELLSRIIFPIGDMAKTEVRRQAEALGLAVCGKPDSQEICFVPGGRYQDFIASHRPSAHEEPGEIVDVSGERIASHQGISAFTIGQRKGLGVAVGEPRFVVELRPEARQVVIGPRELLARREFRAEGINWLIPSPTEEIDCQVKIRYLHQPASAKLIPSSDGSAAVRFDEAQQAITPGQATVFYQGSRVLGGGWIAD